MSTATGAGEDGEHSERIDCAVFDARPCLASFLSVSVSAVDTCIAILPRASGADAASPDASLCTVLDNGEHILVVHAFPCSPGRELEEGF